MNSRRAPQRGFTLIELMIVVCLIGIIASIAIPSYQKMTARAFRTEQVMVLDKLRSHFLSQFENTGTYATADMTSEINPPAADAPIGHPTPWKTSLPAWKDIPFYADGGVRMRYQYEVADGGHTLRLKTCGMFPGLGSAIVPCFGAGSVSGNYTYVETIEGRSTIDITEGPEF